jgi:predicted ATPase
VGGSAARAPPGRPARPQRAGDQPALAAALAPLAPLAPLITAAAARSQVITVSHSQILINALHHATRESETDAGTIELVKDFGETRVAGQEPLGGPAWRWPKR